jgi:hypothetical protein
VTYLRSRAISNWKVEGHYIKTQQDILGELSLINNGNDIAKDVVIRVSSPQGYFDEKSIPIGIINIGESKKSSLILNFNDKILDIVAKDEIQFNVALIYYNSANKKYETSNSFKMIVFGRNSFWWENPEMIASWVTPTQPTIREFASKATGGLATFNSALTQELAARWIFETMRAYGVTYTTDAQTSGDYLQFPIETLKNKGGDCDDNAILYSALLEAIGIKSVLILVPGHIFSGYVNYSRDRNKEGEIIPIETTADNFEDAIIMGKNEYANKDIEAVVKPSDNWWLYPAVILPEKEQIAMPAITKQVGECGVSWSWSEGFVAKVPVKFTNSGNAPGAGCAAVIINQGGITKDTDLDCWVINPGETKDFEYEADFSLLAGDYYCGVY